MDKQLIITIGRESGSGGLEIAKKLGERLGITVYGKNIFAEIGEKFDIDTSRLEKFDEKPRRVLFSRKIQNHYSAPEQQVVEMQREFIKGKADEGQSFIILGRCGIKAVLDCPCVLVRLFIEADKDFKVQRIKEQSGYNETQAITLMSWVDNRRRNYHDQFCTGVKWGDRSSYDLVVKTNKLGIDGTVDFLENYIRMRLGE